MQCLSIRYRQYVSYKAVDEHIQINFIFQGSNKKGISIYQYQDIENKNMLIDMIKTVDINVDYYIYEWYDKNKSRKYYKIITFINYLQMI